MRRQFLFPTLGLLLAAALSLDAVPGGEQPGPGLEIIDGVAGVDFQPAPYPDQPSEPIGTVPYQPYDAPQIYDAPQPYDSSQTYTLPEGQTWAGEPYTPEPYISEPYTLDPYETAPYAPEPVVTTTPEAAAESFAPVEPAVAAADVGEMTQLQVLLADPVGGTLASLNVRNRHFPGLAEAAGQRNLRMAADIVWDVLKKRRVIEATMKRGPGGSVGAAAPDQLRSVLDAINHNAAAADSPVQAAARLNLIMDALAQPVVEDYNIGAAMEQCLLRLRLDIAIVRDDMGNPEDDAVFLELSKTYIRAATTCDFFVFPRQELVQDINDIMRRAQAMFYPDGASIGGDVAGITGNLFHILLMVDFYSRDDNWFRRDVSPAWNVLSRPGRYVADLAFPDQTVPLFGPRGTRELTAPDVCALDELFPKPTPRMNRIGLAASDSYPSVSGKATFGGIYATRSAFEPNARYLAMRVGPPGMLCAVPPHYDFGSLTLMSRNIKFVVDGGGYGGEAALPGAHSVLSLEGHSVVPSTYTNPGEHVDAVWRTNASVDYLTAKAGFTDGKAWQRTLVYVKDLPGETRSDYWVVLDSVDMNNDPEPRRALIRYQLAPGIQAYHDGSGVLATANLVDSSALRFFAIDADSELTVSEGSMGMHPSFVYDAAGNPVAAPAVTLARNLMGDSTTATLIYPGENMNHKPLRIERDSDIIRGRTGALIIDHGLERIDVVAWAPPGTELVTPTLNLQLSADLAVFRVREGKIARIDFVNLERFQAKEPDGGLWSMRVNGAAQTLTIEPDKYGGWQVMADPANRSGATFEDVNFGPAITKRRFGIRPGEMRVIPR